MRLGVNTHFDQGWPLAAFDQVSAASAQGIRDTIGWGKTESTPGEYRFTDANSAHLRYACAHHIDVLITLTPRNKLYESGQTVATPAGRKAFAAYAAAVAAHFPCISAFEIGNEINAHSLTGPILARMPGSYVQIVAAVRAQLDVNHLHVALLSGSSLSVATGFFDRLLDAGLLPLIDGVVVHPYLAVPEQLPQQIARLNAILAKHGKKVPIWASEFGFHYQSPQAAPPHALKMITLLSAAEIGRADWYALREEKWFPNMGLFDAKGAKPALGTFQLGVRLLRAGTARRIDQSDPLTFIFRFGNGPYVVWGAGRPVRFSGPARAFDAQGKPIGLIERLTEQPVMIEGATGFVLGQKTVYADSLIDFDTAAWTDSVTRPKSATQPLTWIDWNWGPYRGVAGMPNFRVTSTTASVGNQPQNPATLIERYTSPEAIEGFVSGCFDTRPEQPIEVRITAGDKVLLDTVVAGTVRTTALTVRQAAGTPLTISYRAVNPGGPQFVRRRVRLTAHPEGEPASCSPKIKNVDAAADARSAD